MITRWLRDNAHVLGDDLEPLRDIVSDARVVAIGESTHRVHAASARPAVEACLEFLADADPAYADAVSLDFGYLPADRTYDGANIRDAAMAENVRWILEHEERIVVAANGHVQRRPFSAPLMTNPLTMLGERLAASLGDQLVVIATTFGGGTLFLHRPFLHRPSPVAHPATPRPSPRS